MKVYGIPNCNSVKKARDWFQANNIPYDFQDFKKLGVTADKLAEWNTKAGYEKILNKQGTTYRGLAPEIKESIVDADSALKVLKDNTSMIKRPVIEDGGFLFFGFDEAVYKEHFGA